jgi:hypothetical protein
MFDVKIALDNFQSELTDLLIGAYVKIDGYLRTFCSPLKYISKAPVDISCPSRTLHKKNNIMQEYSLFSTHHFHHDGSTRPK